MEKEKLNSLLIDKLIEYTKNNDIEIKIDGSNTRLYGSSALDSIELVDYIVQVEEMLDENHNIQVSLVSDKAMSRATSPFRNINTLSEFIIDQIENKA